MFFGLAGLLIILVFGFLALRAGGGIAGGFLDVFGWLDGILRWRSFRRGYTPPSVRRREEKDWLARMEIQRAEDPAGFDAYFGEKWLEDHFGKRWTAANFGKGLANHNLGEKRVKPRAPRDGPGWFDCLTFLRRAAVAFVGVFIWSILMFFLYAFNAPEYEITGPTEVDWQAAAAAVTPMFDTHEPTPSWLMTPEEEAVDARETRNFLWSVYWVGVVFIILVAVARTEWMRWNYGAGIW